MKLPHQPSVSELAAVLETALDAVIIMGEDGRILGWNRVAEATFGWPASETVGRPLRDLVIPRQHRAAHEKGLQRFLETGRGRVLGKHIEIAAIHRDGRELPIELSITPTMDSGRRVFLGFLRDITERTQSRRMLERRAIEAEAISRLTSLAAQSSSFDEVMRACLEAVCEITGWPLGHAFRLTGERPALSRTNIWHAAEPIDYAPLREATEAIVFASGVGLPGKVLETGEAVWIGDTDREPNFPRAGVARKLGLQAAFGFPVVSERKTIAVLEFFNRTSTEADQGLLPVFRTLGEQVGRVFERSAAAARLAQERDALEREIAERERAQQHQRLLLAELDHRVKNTLAVVLSIAQQTAKHSASIEVFADSFVGRIASLAKAHSLLTARKWQSALLYDVVEALMGAYAADMGERITYRGPAAYLSPKAALALSMIVHELLTNATKYGALAGPDGRIDLTWSVSKAKAGPRVIFMWQEVGVNGAEPPAQAGFGSRMIDANARHELLGSARSEWLPKGLRFELEFPLSPTG